MVLLHASNQALIEVAISPSSSPWYQVLSQELGEVENLVVDWRRNGFLYFEQDILQQVTACGDGFLEAKADVDGLFQQLQSNFSNQLKQQIAHKLTDLEQPVQTMVTRLGAYTDKLQAYQVNLEGPHHKMEATAAAIQAEAAKIQAEITTINEQIASLKKEVIADRKAIAEAKKARTGGILETIFGVLLAPVTGGLSLILAGIGVGSIADAEEKIHSLQSTISKYQSTIVGDQQHLSDDEKQIATLSGLTMSTEIALSDIAAVNTALDDLRVTWGVLLGQLTKAASDVTSAQNVDEALVAQVWFDAACITWKNVVDLAQQMSANNAPTPTHVTVG